jgi:hypothetical protein
MGSLPQERSSLPQPTTAWQASQFPKKKQEKIAYVIFEIINLRKPPILSAYRGIYSVKPFWHGF